MVNGKLCIYIAPLSKALYIVHYIHHIHTHIHTPIAVKAMQGINQHIGSNVGFSVLLLKDTLTCRQEEEEPGFKPPTHGSLDDLLYLLRHSLYTIWKRIYTNCIGKVIVTAVMRSFPDSVCSAQTFMHQVQILHSSFISIVSICRWPLQYAFLNIFLQRWPKAALKRRCVIKWWSVP